MSNLLTATVTRAGVAPLATPTEMSFPVDAIKIEASGSGSEITFKGKKYLVQETVAELVAAAGGTLVQFTVSGKGGRHFSPLQMAFPIESCSVEAISEDLVATLSYGGESYTATGQDGAPFTGTATELRDQLAGEVFASGVQNVYKAACLLGDSITGQHTYMTGGAAIQGAQGFWNWANWMAGAPFHFSQNLGVSGDTADGIFSRIWQVHPHLDTVFILAGTNTVNNFSAASSAAQITAEVERLTGTSGVFTLGLQQLKAAGKRVCIATIPPNNGWNSPTDARIQLLDALNTWILASKDAGRVSEVVDLFTPMWDETQPTLRVFKTNYHTDGTHLSNWAGLAGGQAALSALKAMYRASNSESTKYHYRQNMLSLFGQMRTNTGGTSLISFGSGTLASGWRSLNSGSGTPTLVLSNATDYSIHADYVGPMAQMTGVGEKWQKLTITGAVAGSVVRLQLQTNLANSSGISFGDEFFCAVDAYMESGTGVKEVLIQSTAFFTSGTSPVDQPYTASAAQARTTAGISSTAQTDYAYPSGFRAMLITEPVRVPENVNSTAGVTAQLFLDVCFDGAGEAVVYFARPQFWRKIF
jgi:hypothetical protein